MTKAEAIKEVSRAIQSAKFNLATATEASIQIKKVRHYHYILGLADGLSLSGILRVDDVENVEKTVRKELRIRRGEV